MMFAIRRASDYGDESKPCANAEQRPVTYPSQQYPVEYGLIPVVIPERTELKWFIRIDTLEDLVKLIDETHESLVIDRDSIIIYDSYLE